MVEHFIGWLQPILSSHPFAAPLAFVVIHILMAVLFLPCSPMTLMAGVLWGGGLGMGISMVAAISSSGTTFLLSRSFLHGRIEHYLINHYPKIAYIFAQTAIHDWKIIAVSQMNPLVPSSTLGYVFGLTRITLKRYLGFSIVFMLPLQFLFVMTGHSVMNMFISDGHWGSAVILIILFAFFVLKGKRIYKKLCQLLGVSDGA